MFKLRVTYPSLEQEREMLQRSDAIPHIYPVLTKQDLLEARHAVEQVYLDDRLINYIVNIVFATREPSRYGLEKLRSLIACGASPRASIAILKACKALAFLQGRHFVIPDDIKFVAESILRHRIMLTYQASAEDVFAEGIIKSILDSVVVP